MPAPKRGRKKADETAVEQELRALTKEMGGPPVPPARNEESKRWVRRWTRDETREQMRQVESMRLSGHTLNQTRRTILEYYRQRGIGMTRRRVDVLWNRITEEWRAADKADRETSRAEFVRRINRYVQQAEEEVGADGKVIRRADHGAIRGYMALLMKVQGLETPPQVNVNLQFSQALINVTANVMADPEAATRMLHEAQEQARLAQLARESLPALVESAAE